MSPEPCINYETGISKDSFEIETTLISIKLPAMRYNAIPSVEVDDSPIKHSLLMFPGFVAVVSLLLLQIVTVKAQDMQLRYKILMNGNQIGTMLLKREDSSNKAKFSLESETRKRIVILFQISERHTAVFENNVMSTASVLRRVNGKTKIDMQMSFEGSNCKIVTAEKTTIIIIKPVTWSVINLYFTEPVKINEVFSGSFQQLLKIEDMGNHSYKILLPDGSSNYFYYVNGICIKEIIHHSFYTAELLLLQN